MSTVSDPAPSLHDLHTDAGVSLGGSVDGLNEWLDAKEQPPTDADFDRMADEAFERQMMREDAERELAEGRLPVLPLITAKVRRIDPAAFGISA